jgi:nucleoside-diphosphate-sugar epimerase
MHRAWTVLVTGGAGYVGSALVPRLLADGHRVRVLDTFTFGRHALAAAGNSPNLTQIEGDLRDRHVLDSALRGCGAVIHLAGVTDAASFDLDPALGRLFNVEAFPTLVQLAKKQRVERFVLASCASVYGSADADVFTEETHPQPQTGFAISKADCEAVLAREREPGFTPLTIRPATACGYAPRLRLDLPVNALTAVAYHKREITVAASGSAQSHLHVADLAELFAQSLQWPAGTIAGRVYNAAGESLTAREVAELLKAEVGADVRIATVPAAESRTAPVSARRLKRELGWSARRSLRDAVRDLLAAIKSGKAPHALTEPRYDNAAVLRECQTAPLRLAA